MSLSLSQTRTSRDLSRILGVLLLVLLVLVPGVQAYSYTITNSPLYPHTTYFFNKSYAISYDASPLGEKINRVYFSVPRNSRIDFTLYYGSSSTVTGYIESHGTGVIGERTETTVSLGSDSKTYNYLDVTPTFEIDLAGYAKDSDNSTRQGFLLYSYSYGTLDNNLAAFYEVPDLPANTIYKVTGSSSVPFDAQVLTGSAHDVTSGVSDNPIDTGIKWVNFALSLGGYVMEMGLSMLYVLKFLFIDNLLLTVSLYLGISMAYTATTSKNIFMFFKKFISDQTKFINFLMGLWDVFISIISNFRAIFRI